VTYAIYGSRIFKLAKEFRFFASDKSGGMRIILGCVEVNVVTYKKAAIFLYNQAVTK
jgi:hypothetical protein